MIMTENGDYYLWGRNKENQCLIKCNNNDNNNTEFIKVPRKYQYDKQDMEIINIYLGYKETKIVSKQRFEQTNGEILNKHDIDSISENFNPRNSGKKKRNNFKIKLSKVKSWYNKIKGNKKKKEKQREKNNAKSTNQLENNYGLNEYQYVNHQLVICDDNNNNNQWYFTSNNNSTSKFSSTLDSIDETPEIESNDIESSFSANDYGEICYYSPKANKQRFTNTVKMNSNSNANDILYHPVTSKEC